MIFGMFLHQISEKYIDVEGIFLDMRGVCGNLQTCQNGLSLNMHWN